jgi:hypothetical protein
LDCKWNVHRTAARFSCRDIAEIVQPQNEIHMKKILQISLAAFALLTAPLAQAWNYTNGHALLIFRGSPFNNVEFDLGDVSQFIGKADGYTATVTGWNLSLVTGVFGTDLTGVNVVLAATTSDTASSPAAWLSSGDPGAVPVDFSFPTWRANLYGVISGIGTRPLTYLVPTAGASAYSIDPGGTYRLASYDYTVSGGGVNAGAIPQFGGNVAFKTEQTIPGSFGFWQIIPTSASPKPAATYIGTFTIDASGALSFTAGPLVVATTPAITGITRAGNLTTVTFTTTASGNYSLAYTNALGSPLASWPIVSGPVAGDGSNKSLNHTTSDGSGFYGVVRSP